ncbi:uncharacterized protein LY79DRAFT_1476 [Colletotrichum navitas]|uniref:Uncharacterized protein n=1 Tax=Colletotrichum navitas TaxID=681940 RepID=A0AAD8QCD3_9PEZI|nr:uncharacterized protein LY79DRAFT_1476 [Colletotrichum navitas]KAK1599947.1 hypothetical protein LY79DRAFT_1476 [Colletotrichum navitas]
MEKLFNEAEEEGKAINIGDQLLPTRMKTSVPLLLGPAREEKCGGVGIRVRYCISTATCRGQSKLSKVTIMLEHVRDSSSGRVRSNVAFKMMKSIDSVKRSRLRRVSEGDGSVAAADASNVGEPRLGDPVRRLSTEHCVNTVATRIKYALTMTSRFPQNRANHDNLPMIMLMVTTRPKRANGRWNSMYMPSNLEAPLQRAMGHKYMSPGLLHEGSCPSCKLAANR